MAGLIRACCLHDLRRCPRVCSPQLPRRRDRPVVPDLPFGHVPRTERGTRLGRGIKRGRNVAVFAYALTLFHPTRATAWGFDEHEELGRIGYQAACDQVAGDLHILADRSNENICEQTTDEWIIRWCLACKTHSPSLYGQSVAIAGDHVGSPEELTSIEGQQIAASLSDYTFLALVNTTHFHPEASRNWLHFHDLALKEATSLDPDQSIAERFQKAFFTSAFADHFLQDSFSAGHSGFNRPSSGAVAAKAFHDAWNTSGRLVKAPSGDCWLEYGDGKLRFLSQFGRYHIADAEHASAYDLISAFVTGTRVSAREIRPTYFVPIAITPNALPEPISGKESVEQGSPLTQHLYYQQVRGLDQSQCTAETVPIDGMSNPSIIKSGVDYWVDTSIGRDISFFAFSIAYNRYLADFMNQPAYWEGTVSPVGVVHRYGSDHYAPSASLGLLTPPLYLIHGLIRTEIGLQARGYVFLDDHFRIDGFGTPFLRASLEAATVIFRLQAGPSFDFQTGEVGIQASLGVELAKDRSITGGGSLRDF